MLTFTMNSKGVYHSNCPRGALKAHDVSKLSSQPGKPSPIYRGYLEILPSYKKHVLWWKNLHTLDTIDEVIS